MKQSAEAAMGNEPLGISAPPTAKVLTPITLPASGG
jgi:hypothetical protein